MQNRSALGTMNCSWTFYQQDRKSEGGESVFVPKPSGAAYAAGIAMHGFANWRLEYRREGVLRQFRRKFDIEFVYFGHSSSEYKNVRVECDNDQREPTR